MIRSSPVSISLRTGGTHPAFPNLWGFGRRILPSSTGEIERLVAYRIGAAQALSTYAGNPITYVKAHGALGNLTQTDHDVATAIARAIKAVNPELVCMTFAGALMQKVASDIGLRVCCEVFADRAYDEEGHLVHRKTPGAVLQDAGQAAARMRRMVEAKAIETISDRLLCAVDFTISPSRTRECLTAHPSKLFCSTFSGRSSIGEAA
jgi:5-oxoprolinase (ATP-hydrolysing) subunit A